MATTANGASAPQRLQVTLSYVPATAVQQKALKDEIESHLPLSDLVWRSSTRAVSRTIEGLQLDFRDFHHAMSEAAKPQQIPMTLLDRPYLHILFIFSDDNEQYRAILRQKVRDWLDSLSSKRQTEWLIVHVTAQKSGPRKFYQTKGSVFDKLRADFNTGKRDRCVQLPLPGAPASEEDPTIWRDFVAKLKELLVASIDANFTSYEDDVRRVDAQRQMPGWNFCTFFVNKEGLAQSYEAMNLLEDALVQYDELEASYALAGKGQSLSWFSQLGGNEPGDDALSILDMTKKPYRQLIMQNSISIFDFRIYLFARQAALVSSMGKVAELAKRAKPFIYSISKLLRAHGGALQRNFLEYFVFSACMEVVNICTSMVKARNMNSAAIPGLLPLLAEMLELASRQAEKFGIFLNYLPKHHPFTMSADVSMMLDGDTEEGEDKRPLPVPTSPVLRQMLESESAFDVIYKDLLQQAYNAWTDSGRPRTAIKLRGSMAALEQGRKQFQTAEEYYGSLSHRYSETRWVAIEGQILRQSIIIQEQLQKPRDRLLSTLALLRSGIEKGSVSWTVGRAMGEAEDRVAAALIAEVRTLSLLLEKDLASNAFPVFVLDLVGLQGRQSDSDEDGPRVAVHVTSFLPCDVEVDELRFKFVSVANGEPLWLTSPATTLHTGKATVYASAITSVTGAYALDLSQIRFGKVVFQYSHRPQSRAAVPSASAAHPDSVTTGTQPIVVFPYDALAVEVSCKGSDEIHLDQPRRLLVTIRQGRNALLDAKIRLGDPQKRLSFHMSETAAITDACVVDTSLEGTVALSQIVSGSSMELCIPYNVNTAENIVDVPATLEYCTVTRPNAKRQLRTLLRVRLALPLAVNVQDFLRDDCIISRFTVATDDLQPITIRDVDVASTEDYTVTPAVLHRAEPVSFHASMPSNFIFRIRRKDSHARQIPPSPLRVRFHYRTSRGGINALLRNHLSAVFAKHQQPLSERCRLAIISGIIAIPTAIKQLLHALDNAGTLSDVQLEAFDPIFWRERLAYFIAGEPEWHSFEFALSDVFKTPVSLACLDKQPWKLLAIPFEVPYVSIYNRVRLDLCPDSSQRIAVGDLVPAILRIHTSYKWASAEQRIDLLNRTQRLLYEVLPVTEDWLLSGRKRAEFALEPSDNGEKDIEVHLQLMPIRTGRIILPSVSVVPLVGLNHQVDGSTGRPGLPTSEMFYVNAASSIEVIPAESEYTSVYFDRRGQAEVIAGV